MGRKLTSRSARSSLVQGVRIASATALLVASLHVSPAVAQSVQLRSTITVQETATTNVNLSPSSSAEEDLVTEITPWFSIQAIGAHTSLIGQIAVPIALYARTGAENNKVYPSGHLLGTAELIDDFFFLEGEASVEQQYFSPFGARPSGFSNATENRYRSSSFRVSPVIRGVTPRYNVAYELRNNNIWSNLGGTPIETSNAHYTQWIGDASNAVPATLGWSVHAESTEIRYNDQRPIEMRLVRLKPIYAVDPELKLWLNVGYEDNRFTLTENNGAIYGGGLEWRPTPRTRVVGNYEYRFFGDSYLFSFDHRTPLSIWNVRIARDITTYPQQLGTLPAGVDIGGIIGGLFLAQFPDPTERQNAVDQFIRDRGLPSILTSPLALYSQQILLQESQVATAGIIGARNSIVFTIFNVRTEPIAGSGNPLPAPLAAANNNTQTGANAVWSLRVTPTVTLAAMIEGYRTVANGPLEGTTRQGSARVTVSSLLSARTTVFAGARYQELRSDVTSDYNEAAVYVGLSYAIR
jgi:uncharacterized protein (PEP-CTERM system associated)